MTTYDSQGAVAQKYEAVFCAFLVMLSRKRFR